MKVKITPTGESAQVMEFNVSLPCGANASIAPVSTLTVTQRWAKVVNVSTTGTEYVQVTKFDVRVTPAPAPTAAIASVAKSK